jgi:hypothetical protein
MSMWLYQLSPGLWSPERYRLEIWEGERWNWPVGGKSGAGQVPKPGDTVVFFYAPSGGTDPGFYGWAVVLEWHEPASSQLYFRPTAPSDSLKMFPWWDRSAEQIANRIRGKMKQRTLWVIPWKLAVQVRQGIVSWLSRATLTDEV